MEKLNPKIIKIKAKLVTPIHIHNNEILDRMSYFLLDDSWSELQILNKKWLNFCAEKDLDLFKELILNIEKWNFLKVEDLKIDFYNNYINEFIDEYWINEEIYVWLDAKKSLLLNNDYSTNKKQKWNQWEIKRFSRFWIDNELFIPWSTIKWLFRTIFLNDEIKKINWDYKEQARQLENIDREDRFKKDLFAFLLFEDVKINNKTIEIQKIESLSKPKNIWNKPNKGAPQVVELLKQWDFEIIIKDLKNQIDIDKLEQLIKNYSTTIISREEQIIDNIWYNGDLLSVIDQNYNNSSYPIKLWMFKKSLTYKLFWEEMVEKLNKISWKEWLNEARRLWIWDKTIYIDEDKNPIWWITLSDIQILDK